MMEYFHVAFMHSSSKEPHSLQHKEKECGCKITIKSHNYGFDGRFSDHELFLPCSKHKILSVEIKKLEDEVYEQIYVHTPFGVAHLGYAWQYPDLRTGDPVWVDPTQTGYQEYLQIEEEEK